MSSDPFTITAARCASGGRPVVVAADQAPTLKHAETGISWIHIISHDTEATTTYLVEQMGLRPLEVEQALDPSHPADVHDHPDVMFVEVPAVVRSNGEEEFLDVGFFLGKHFLLSVSIREISVV